MDPGPSTQLIDMTSLVWMWNTMINEEKIAHISSYLLLSEAKISRMYWSQTKLKKSLRIYALVVVNL